ncbi:response regulator [Alteromonadaceae bacterium M269]|nr:response regulator [Alteromonadaceae bacterium M269]
MKESIAENCKVLIVDDQVLAQGYMKYSLEELGFRDITYVDKAQNAIEKISIEPYDLVVCSYNLKRDQDGYYLYDELKNTRLLPLTCAFVFISADTTAEVVHSIVELQPDDFLAKPFTVKELDKRLTRLLMRKRAMRDIYNHMERKQFDIALDKTEALLTDPSQAQYFPTALKTKGELLLATKKPEKAKEFYEAILNVQDFAWAQLGLINSFIELGNEEEAERLILRVAFKPESQLAAYDMLSTLHINNNDLDTALETIQMASEVSPRNIRRHQKAREISRIVHDYDAHFEASKKIVKFAKNSMQDKPENYLNAARAGIDYAMTLTEDDSEDLIKQANSYIKQFSQSFPKSDLKAQVTVINARLLHLQDETEKAASLIAEVEGDNFDDQSLEDLIDKAKAFHALGLFEQSETILDEVEKRCISDKMDGQLFLRFVQQEKKEKREIKQTPRALNNSAVQYYERGELDSALKTFRQAYTVMPKNPAIALNLLQAIAMKSKEKGLSKNANAIKEKCIKTIEEGYLNEEQTERYQKVKSYLQEVV